VLQRVAKLYVACRVAELYVACRVAKLYVACRVAKLYAVSSLTSLPSVKFFHRSKQSKQSFVLKTANYAKHAKSFAAKKAQKA
jgi:hypothetical protein